MFVFYYYYYCETFTFFDVFPRLIPSNVLETKFDP